jgi:hypothetical protein
LKTNKHLRWALWSGLIGSLAAAALVVLFRFSQNPMIYRILMLLDRPGVWVASWATSVVFTGDRIMYPGLSAATFFDIVLILATGLQTGFLGACISLILSRKIPGVGRLTENG